MNERRAMKKLASVFLKGCNFTSTWLLLLSKRKQLDTLLTYLTMQQRQAELTHHYNHLGHSRHQKDD